MLGDGLCLGSGHLFNKRISFVQEFPSARKETWWFSRQQTSFNQYYSSIYTRSSTIQQNFQNLEKTS